MPTYDYRCNACNHEFELFQAISENPKKKCPDCGKLKLERLIGAGAAVIFKGGGFYETDYRSDSYKKGAEAEKKASENGKSDKKPDKKPDKNNDKKSDATKSNDAKATAKKPKSKSD